MIKYSPRKLFRHMFQRSDSSRLVTVMTLLPVKSELIFPRSSNITIKWEAHDLDKDKLTYLVVYSNDGGLTWPTTIAEDIEQNSLTFNADSLPGNSIDLFCDLELLPLMVPIQMSVTLIPLVFLFEI